MARNLGDMLDARRAPDKIVLIETGADGATARSSWAARALDELINAVARGLSKRGLRRGDSVGILSLNRTEFVAAYFGAMRAGLVAVPINWKLPADTVAYIAEVAQILYTSGSTGRPKGVPLSHAGQRWAVEVASTEDVSAHRLLVAAPMFHMNALINLKFAFHNK